MSTVQPEKWNIYSCYLSDYYYNSHIGLGSRSEHLFLAIPLLLSLHELYNNTEDYKYYNLYYNL